MYFLLLADICFPTDTSSHGTAKPFLAAFAGCYATRCEEGLVKLEILLRILDFSVTVSGRLPVDNEKASHFWLP